MSHAAAIPFAARIPRKALPRPPVLSGNQKNLRPVELIGAQRVYDPPRDGDTPARPARMPIYLSVNTRQWHAVAEDFFAVRNFDFLNRVSMPKGSHTPVRQRGNIVSVRPRAYGSQFELEPDQGSGELTPIAGMPE